MFIYANYLIKITDKLFKVNMYIHLTKIIFETYYRNENVQAFTKPNKQQPLSHSSVKTKTIYDVYSFVSTLYVLHYAYWQLGRSTKLVIYGYPGHGARPGPVSQRTVHWGIIILHVAIARRKKRTWRFYKTPQNLYGDGLLILSDGIRNEVCVSFHFVLQRRKV